MIPIPMIPANLVPNTLGTFAGKCDHGQADWVVFPTGHAFGPLVPSCPEFARPPRRPVGPVALKLGGHGLGRTNEPKSPK